VLRGPGRSLVGQPRRGGTSPRRGFVRWLVDHQRFDHKSTRAGGAEAWPYAAPKNVGCWDSVSGYHGVVAAGSHPQSPRARERLAEAIEYLRIHRGYLRSSPPKGLSNNK